MFKYSSIVSIVYFSVNIIFLIILATIVYKQGHHKLKSKSYVKDVWSQRAIYAPLIIHFYDTATDIGVIYNWAILMKEEQKGLVDYESVNMTIFFWTGIAFLAAYRLCSFIFAIGSFITGDGDWYDWILVLFDVYIFKAVYQSFSEAKDTISANAAKRQQNVNKKRGQREENKKQMETAIEMTEIPDEVMTQQNVEQKAEDDEIEPSELQWLMHLGESVTESMPQIVLQSVFVIRSANDASLAAAGSNIYLILFSIIASLFSISGKFVFIDKGEMVTDKAKSLKPSMKCPGCIQYWYIVRVIWRMSHVMSRFGVFVLMWTVLGGAWLPIWAGIMLIGWTVICMVIDDESILVAMLLGLVQIVAVVGIKKDVKKFVFKFIETTIGLILITIFATLTFECGICSDSNSRQLFNNDNKRVLLFWALALGSAICDMILYAVMYRNDVIVETR